MKKISFSLFNQFSIFYNFLFQIVFKFSNNWFLVRPESELLRFRSQKTVIRTDSPAKVCLSGREGNRLFDDLSNFYNCQPFFLHSIVDSLSANSDQGSYLVSTYHIFLSFLHFIGSPR